MEQNNMRIQISRSAMVMTAVVMAHAWGGSAIAADLSVAPAYKAPPPMPAASWSGFYVGSSVGMRSAVTDAVTTGATAGGVPQAALAAAFCTAGFATCPGGLQSFDGTSFRWGAYVGYNWQIGPQWVVGIEGDWAEGNKEKKAVGEVYPGGATTSGTFLTGRTDDAFSVKTTWDASARARLGYVVTPTLLLYATGGAAWLRMESTSTCGSISCAPGGFGPNVITNADTKVGWTVGGGAETMLWGNWLLRAQYRYADFGTASATDSRSFGAGAFAAGFSPQVATYDVHIRTHTAEIGLAYKF